LAAQSETNRQGRGQMLEGEEARRVLDLLRADAARNYDHYLEMLNEGPDGKPADPGRAGLARELARMNLTLNLYTQWYWKIDLHNLMHFIALRADPHAQYEIRAYAETLLHVLDRWVPMTAAACREHVIGGARLSATALKVVRRMVRGEKVTQGESGLPPREWRELAALLGLDPA
jgi:thymidylate synthase (FAD)